MPKQMIHSDRMLKNYSKDLGTLSNQEKKTTIGKGHQEKSRAFM